MSNNHKQPQQPKPRIFGPAVRTIILMLVVVGVAYPLVLVAIGQGLMPVQSKGSLITLNDNVGSDVVGSTLIAQEFHSSKFFHPRPASESASGVDPHITLEDAMGQIENVSKATGITQNYLKTLIKLNVQMNRADNLSAFAPAYVNVLQLNLELVRQYPDIYAAFTEGRK